MYVCITCSAACKITFATKIATDIQQTVIKGQYAYALSAADRALSADVISLRRTETAQHLAEQAVSLLKTASQVQVKNIELHAANDLGRNLGQDLYGSPASDHSAGAILEAARALIIRAERNKVEGGGVASLDQANKLFAHIMERSSTYRNHGAAARERIPVQIALPKLDPTGESLLKLIWCTFICHLLREHRRLPS